MNNRKVRYGLFVPGAAGFLAGLCMLLIYAPKVQAMSGMVLAGYLLMVISVYVEVFVIYKEYERTDAPVPKLLQHFMGDLVKKDVEIPDWDPFSTFLGSFRNAYHEFFRKRGLQENSCLQAQSTQLLWHALSLQKRRMDRLCLTMETKTVRHADSIHQQRHTIKTYPFFDGRYDIKDVDERIYAYRTFLQDEKEVGRFKDDEVAHYSILSAKPVGGKKIICPGCGNETTRENLIDGCDYCGTKFAVEDLENRIGAFGFQQNLYAKNGNLNNFIDRYASLVLGIFYVPALLFALCIPIIYMQGVGIIGRVVVALLCLGAAALLLGIVLVPILLLAILPFLRKQKKLLAGETMLHPEKIAQLEEATSKQVRAYDPLFSLKGFMSDVNNKLSAIHFAENNQEINVFSEVDLSDRFDAYKEVVGMDREIAFLSDYRQEEGLQKATVDAEYKLFVFDGAKVSTLGENITLKLEKSAACKTQAVCGPAVYRCPGCGSSISLMEGRRCRYCGGELDLKHTDWVITDYKANTFALKKR